MNRPTLKIDPSKAALVEAAAAHVADAIIEAVRERGRCTIALSGGSTPGPVHEALAQRDDLPWDRVTVFFADERCVPPDDPESNYRLARETLLAARPAIEVVRMEGERTDRDAAAADYAAALPDRLDVLLLGMGGDGHTCSLFPGHPAVDERERRVLAIDDSPKPPPHRLTLTAPVIEAARGVVVLVSGAGKADMVARALTEAGPARDLPIRLALRGTWFLDQDAAGALDDNTKRSAV